VTGALRDIAHEIGRRPPPQLLSFERLSATERAAATLENRRIGVVQAIPADPDAVDAIESAIVRRLLATIWSDPHWDSVAARLVLQARDAGQPGLDRALILAYLRCYPTGHRAFVTLRTAAAAASTAHDWAWAARGDRWSLWTPDGPNRARDAIAAGTMADDGLERCLAGSAFLAAADDADRPVG
jgi:hypothetical protein